MIRVLDQFVEGFHGRFLGIDVEIIRSQEERNRHEDQIAEQGWRKKAPKKLLRSKHGLKVPSERWNFRAIDSIKRELKFKYYL
jgi:hypothetical protein